MKKIVPIIIGILSAIIVISNDSVNSAVSQEDFEDQLYIRDIRWSDIFGPTKDGYDLYKLVYSNMFIQPEKKALKDTAQKFGLTSTEAKMAVDGGVSAIYNNPDKKFTDISLDQAMNEFISLTSYYNDTIEIYALSEELDAISKPNEIFSNGDLSDSGFDLIDDLNTMEKILFLNETPVKSGSTFNGKIDSPNLDFLNQSGPIIETAGITNIETPTATTIATTSATEAPSDNATITQDKPDSQLETPLLDEDVCNDTTTTDLNSALNNFDEENNPDNNTSESGENPSSDGTNTGGTPEIPYTLLNEDGDINPAPSGKWGGSFCPNLVPSSSASGDGYKAIAGQNGFESLSYAFDSLLNDSLTAGAAAQLGGENLSLKVAVCFSTELIYATYSTFYPQDNCIKCEVDKINEILDNVLSHSLIPNKVTGNFMASTKCPSALSALPSLNIIAIPAPISTPMNADLISEKNIFEEWNTFVEQYHPFLSDAGTIPGDFESKFILENKPKDQTLSDTFREISKIKSVNLSNALSDIENLKYTNNASDINMYSRVFMSELRQMNNIFKSIKMTLNNIDEKACKVIKEKPSI